MGCSFTGSTLGDKGTRASLPIASLATTEDVATRLVAPWPAELPRFEHPGRSSLPHQGASGAHPVARSHTEGKPERIRPLPCLHRQIAEPSDRKE